VGRPAYESARVFRLTGPVPGKVKVIFSHDMIRSAMRYGYTKAEAKSLHAFCILDTPPGRPIIVLRLDATLADIVHECGHAAFSLLQYADIPVTYEDNEMYCYVLDFIFDRIYRLQGRVRAQKLLKDIGLSGKKVKKSYDELHKK